MKVFNLALVLAFHLEKCECAREHFKHFSYREFSRFIRQWICLFQATVSEDEKVKASSFVEILTTIY